MNSMKDVKRTSIPHFQLLLSHRKFCNVQITEGEEVIHCVKNVHNFYNELGYTEEFRDNGLSFDEFVRLQYDGKHEVCLQARIIEYLIKYSSAFVKKYGDQYESWLAGCREQMQNGDGCIDCIKG